jgi:formylglycine-generating enzyme required for sulfatase activity
VAGWKWHNSSKTPYWTQFTEISDSVASELRNLSARGMKDAMPQSEPATRFAEEARSAGACFSDGRMLPEMVVVPPGKFWMGADDEGDRGAGGVDRPRHWVKIGYSLAVSRYPISFDQWDAFADGDPDVHRPEDGGLGRGRRPVVNVSWEDAEHYVRWLSIAAGRAYRLLSEAEWEYCCRAGAGDVVAGGGKIGVGDANFPGLDCHDRLGVGRVGPVGTFGPNALGLFDIDGNVSELVADAWHDSYHGAPSDGSAWEQIKATMWRVVRGGRLGASPGNLRIPFRDSVHHLKRVGNMSFRVACGLD